MIGTLAHIAFGALTAFVALISPALALINLAVFIAYELNQELHLKDASHQEILEFALGLVLGETLIFIVILFS